MKEVAFGLDLGGTSLKYGLVTRAGEILAQGSVPTGREGKMAGSPGGPLRRDRPPPAPRAGARRHGARRRSRMRGQRRRPPRKDLHALAEPPVHEGFRARRVRPPRVRPPHGRRERRERRGARRVPARGGPRIRQPPRWRRSAPAWAGGSWSDGQLIRGRWGTAGEIGHGVFQPGGLKCGCGSRGCLEQYTASLALKRYYREAGGRAAQGVRLRVRDIIDEAKAGRPRARAAVSAIARNLGIGLATCASLVPVDVIAIGGGQSVLGPLLLRPARAAFDAHALPGRPQIGADRARAARQSRRVGRGRPARLRPARSRPKTAGACGTAHSGAPFMNRVDPRLDRTRKPTESLHGRRAIG